MNAQTTPTPSKISSQTLAPPAALLRCQNPEALNDSHCLEIHLSGVELFVGRGSGNHAVLQAYGISRRHARLYVEHGAWHVEDLNSTNGVRVNDSQVQSMRLIEGDSIAFGRVVYTYNLASQSHEDIRDTQADMYLDLQDKTVPIRPTSTSGSKPASGADAAGSVTNAAMNSRHNAPQSSTPILLVIVVLLLIATGGILLLR